MKTEIDGYYKRITKDLTNMLYDEGFLSDDLSRESIDRLEDYLGFVLQAQCDMAVKSAKLAKKFRNLSARGETSENPSEAE